MKVELRRTTKKEKVTVHAVMTMEDQIRRLVLTPADTFDARWKPLLLQHNPYPVTEAIEKWLDSHDKHFIVLAGPAEKELRAMLASIPKNGAAIVKVEMDDSKKEAFTKEFGKKTLVLADLKACEALEDEVIINLFNTCYPQHAIESFKDKKKVAKAIWDYLKANAESLVASTAGAKGPATPAKTMKTEIPGSNPKDEKKVAKSGPKPGRESLPENTGGKKGAAAPAAKPEVVKGGKPAAPAKPAPAAKAAPKAVNTGIKPRVDYSTDKTLYKTLEKKSMRVGSNREVVYEACAAIKKGAGATMVQISEKAELDLATTAFCVKQMLADGRMAEV